MVHRVINIEHVRALLRLGDSGFMRLNASKYYEVRLDLVQYGSGVGVDAVCGRIERAKLAALCQSLMDCARCCSIYNRSGRHGPAAGVMCPSDG